MLDISVDLLYGILPKVKYGMVVWVQNHCFSTRSHCWLRAVAHCYCPASLESMVLYIASAGKSQNSKLKSIVLIECAFLCTIVKSKSHYVKPSQVGDYLYMYTVLPNRDSSCDFFFLFKRPNIFPFTTIFKQKCYFSSLLRKNIIYNLNLKLLCSPTNSEYK